MRSTRLPSWIERLVGLAATPVPPHVFGLTPGRLDYGRFEGSSTRMTLAELRSMPLAPDTFQSGLLGGPLTDAAAFRKQIKELVNGVGMPIKRASLVLPDSWLRVTFSESEELPRRESDRDEVLRWKLKRLVPFRVDELRVQGVEVSPLAGQTEPRRVMLAFAVDLLLAQLEEAFAAAGVWIGQITSASLALYGSVARSAGRGLTATVLVDDSGYSLVFALRGEPVLHRFKAVGSSLDHEALAGLVGRDMRLTRNFLQQQLPDVEIERVLLAAPESEERHWQFWLEDGLMCPVEPLRVEHLPLVDPRATGANLPGSGLFSSWSELAPMLGAASREVA